MTTRKLTKEQRGKCPTLSEALNARIDALNEALKVSEKEKVLLQQGRDGIYEREYARRETLAALVGKFKQNVAEFTRVFEDVMSK